MKRTLGITLAVAFAISAASAPALAGPPDHGEKAFGAGIKYHCEASYGQLVSAGKAAARAGEHPDFTPSGARAFATGPLFAAHGCIEIES